MLTISIQHVDSRLADEKQRIKQNRIMLKNQLAANLRKGLLLLLLL
jgi:hypothetical protein